jgi:Fe-S cluster biosynthesis and repair protein YggX
LTRPAPAWNNLIWTDSKYALYLILRLSKTMKYFLLLILIFSANIAISQKKNWTKKQILFIEETGLNQDDHRGIILNESISATITIKEAIEEFLYSNDLSDLKKYNIIADNKYKSYLNKPLDLFLITELYLKLK